MITPLRAVTCIEYLDLIERDLEYFMEAGDKFKQLKNNEIKYLRDYINKMTLLEDDNE